MNTDEIKLDLSDDEADQLLRAACADNEDVWMEQFGKILLKTGDIQTIKLNYLQEQVCDAIRWCREGGYPCRVIILKPRQKGSSTVTTGALCHMLQRRQANGLIIGGEFSQTDNLWKITKRYSDLDKMKWPHPGARITNDRGVFGNGSELMKETAQDSEAGRSGTFHFVLATEIGRWKDTPARNGAEILTGVLACIPDLPDTVAILESTAQGPSGVFFDRWNAADDWEHVRETAPKEWKGRWIRVFAPWYSFEDSVDLLSAVEAEDIRRSLTEVEKDLLANYSVRAKDGKTHTVTLGHLSWRRKILEGECDGDETKFDREFPATPQHAFRASARTRFSRDGLEWQRKNIKNPNLGLLELSDSGKLVNWRETSADEAIYHVFEKPRDGYYYLISADLMTGGSQVGGKDPDCHSVIVWRKGYFDRERGWIPPSVAARITPECRWDIDVLVEWSWRLAMYYGKCLFVSEINCDRGFVELLRGKGNIPLYQREIFNHVNQKRSKAFGWHTSSSTRLQIEETMARGIRTYGEDGGGVHLNCRSIVSECETFCVNNKGKAEALRGSHDDDVLGAGIGLCVIEQATRYRHRYEDIPIPRDLQRAEAAERAGNRGRGTGRMGRRGFS